MSLPTIKIRGYRLLERVGSGGSGAVFRGLQEDLGREVAIKILTPGLFDEEETRARFLREAKLQASLSHPNLLALYDAGFVDGTPYLVTEYAGGGTLRDLAKATGAFRSAQVVRLGASIAAGLAHAHEAGIVHRDLKPENILFNLEGQPKVADFGLAKAERGRRTRLTACGIILGTPGYMAPEVIRGDPAGPPADLHALGIILFEMITGERLFGTGSLSEVLQRQLETDTEALHVKRADVTSALERLVLSCLAKEPKRRPTAHEVEERLWRLASEDATEATVLRPQKGPPSKGTTPAASAGGHAQARRATPTVRSSARTGPPAASQRQSSTGYVPWLAAGALVVVLGGLLGAALARRQAPPTVQTVASEVPVRSGAVTRTAPPPSTTARPDAPAALRATVSCEAVHLWFATPVPAGARVVVRPTSPGLPKSLSLASGARDVVVRELKANTNYQALLEGFDLAEQVSFRTLDRCATHPFPLLAERVSDCRELSAASEGDELHLVWRQRPRDGATSVIFRESLDGGLTWTEAKPLASGSQAISRPTLRRLKAGLVVSWLWGEPPDERGMLRFRPAGSTEWQPAVQVACTAPGPLIAVAGPEELDLLTGRPAAGGKTELRRQRLKVGFSGAKPGAVALPQVSRNLGWAEYVLCRGRANLFAIRPVGGGRYAMACAGSDRPDAGLWDPFVPLGPTDVTPIDPVVTEAGGILLAAHAAGKKVRVFSSSDGGRTFRSSDQDFGLNMAPDSDWTPGFTSLAGGPGQFVLGAIYWRFGDSLGMHLMTSPEGLYWTRSKRLEVTISVHQRVLSKLTSRGLV
ncbi:MAG: protein kinase, partial [Candidatus Riflebacteria bacterium]|nr:protein kinase [Candidatus Riflebacteria bacterium]